MKKRNVIGSCFLLMLLFLLWSVNSLKFIFVPPSFDFASLVVNVFNADKPPEQRDTTNTFCEKYRGKLGIQKETGLYGLALAYQTYGLVCNSPRNIFVAKLIFWVDSILSNNQKERGLAWIGQEYLGRVLSGKYIKPVPSNSSVEKIIIRKTVVQQKDFQKVIIGKSMIRVTRGTKIKTQVDRLSRDWLYAHHVTLSPNTIYDKNFEKKHEGAVIKELMDKTGAKVYPVWGTRVERFNENWFAPDAEGIFRFEISKEKVINCPTIFIVDERSAILNDTHGISAIAWDSIDAELVVGCGDNPGKMDAAYYLAERGVNVYMPTDRFIAMLMGTNSKGMIIGSAPIKEAAGGVIIGDQPIVVDINEKIVVSNDSSGEYPLYFYDAPYRYFCELEKYLDKKMNIFPVNVLEYEKAMVVVDTARQLGAKLIGIRVKSKEEHDAMYAWLKENKNNRVILFHTAIYPDGRKLFYEFPAQTSFGDIHPEVE
jgi:hypothetical protein